MTSGGVAVAPAAGCLKVRTRNAKDGGVLEFEVDEVAAILHDLHLAGWILRPEGVSEEAIHNRARVGFDLILHGLRAPKTA